MPNSTGLKCISELKLWKDNPRGIDKDSYKRLKKQIIRLGKYKPLLTTKDNIVIGGNMRLRVFQELEIKKIETTEIEFHETDGGFYATINGKKDGDGVFKSVKQGMIEYALSDNDEAGYYEKQPLAELIYEIPINYDNYNINTMKSKSLKEVLEEYTTIDEKEIDENLETEHKCPKCGYSW